MTLWLCRTCGNEFPDTDDAPSGDCAICADERQYLPEDGQAWTSAQQLRGDGLRTELTEIETDLFALTTTDRFGIGQRGLVVRTAAGILIWEPPGYLDDDAVEAVSGLGQVRMITASHPHLVGASVEWAHRLTALQDASVPVLKHERDLRWITRPDPVIESWSGERELLPGVRLFDAGGHFPGSALVHWADGADGRGALFTGDTIAIGADRRSVNVMRSYVNNIPLPQRAVERILAVVEPLAYDRIYSGFGLLDGDAKAIVDSSLRRYIRWIRGDETDY